ncbi:MAG TPA: hypothetical protein VFX79_00575 [Candidatus Saccharimonadales bacterium]|nr:hypothetical protein [Candidatus Saccharimonadales bacterium]
MEERIEAQAEKAPERYERPLPPTKTDEEKARLVRDFATAQGMERWRAYAMFPAQIKIIWETGERPAV